MQAAGKQGIVHHVAAGKLGPRNGEAGEPAPLRIFLDQLLVFHDHQRQVADAVLLRHFQLGELRARAARAECGEAQGEQEREGFAFHISSKGARQRDCRLRGDDDDRLDAVARDWLPAAGAAARWRGRPTGHATSVDPEISFLRQGADPRKRGPASLPAGSGSRRS